MKKRAALYAAGAAAALLLPLSAFAAYGTYGYGTPYVYTVPFAPYSSSQYYDYCPSWYTYCGYWNWDYGYNYGYPYQYGYNTYGYGWY